MSNYFILLGLLVITLIIVFSQPDGLEKVNSKRSAKGKSELTADEYQRKVKNDRILSCIILAVGYTISLLITIFA
ncbi:MAG: hypothetical protein FWG14_08385 [Peptococcaceae bacterium]|nr:hypothetical protein [Peptococcaceae bacterium]